MCLVEDERCHIIRGALIRLCLRRVPLDGTPAVVRTYPAPEFAAPVDDKLLRYHGIAIEIGRVKNKNKNPVAEKAIRELEDELLRTFGWCSDCAISHCCNCPTGCSNSQPMSVSKRATDASGPVQQSAKPLAGRSMILEQHKQCLDNNPHSECSKAPRINNLPKTNIVVGDLVYIYGDRNKS